MLRRKQSDGDSGWPLVWVQAGPATGWECRFLARQALALRERGLGQRLERPLAQFLDEAPLSSRFIALLEGAARALEVQSVAQLCTPACERWLLAASSRADDVANIGFLLGHWLRTDESDR